MMYQAIRKMMTQLGYAVLVLLSVNALTFALFFSLNSPDDMARMHLGQKYVARSSIEAWKHQRGYDQPLFFSPQESGIRCITQTLFVQQTAQLFLGNFGVSDLGRQINDDIRQRMGPSLSVSVPSLFLGLIIHIGLTLLLIFFRKTAFFEWFDQVCVVLISISGLFFIIAGQYLFSVRARWMPISGYQPGSEMWRFVALPVLLYVLMNLGSAVRWYRSIFLEILDQEYVRLASAKGLSEARILLTHVFPNGLLPIITNVVVSIPSLFLGSLLLESFFGIPGLGSYTLDAINQQDFAVVRVMVFLGTVLYLLGLMLTDLAYAWADPRIRWNKVSE